MDCTAHGLRIFQMAFKAADVDELKYLYLASCLSMATDLELGCATLITACSPVEYDCHFVGGLDAVGDDVEPFVRIHQFHNGHGPQQEKQD